MAKTNKLIKILLIEDNSDDVQLLRIILSQTETTAFDLTVVDRLKTGLTVLETKPFDIILLDLSLPDAWGIESIQKVLRFTSVIPIVVLSGSNDELLALKAVQLGAQDYLVKNEVTNQILIRTIRHAIERQRLIIDFERQMEAFLNSETRWHNMIEHNADGIVIFDANKTIHFVNLAAEEMFAQSNQELIGTSFNFPIDIDNSVEIEITQPPHQVGNVIAEMRLVTTTWDEQPAYLATLRDITQRKQAEKELTQYRKNLEDLVQERTVQLKEALTDAIQSQEKIDAIINSVGDGLIVTDLTYQVILSNPAAESLFNIRVHDILGQKITSKPKHSWLYDFVRSVLIHRLVYSEVDIKLEGEKPGEIKIIHVQASLVDNYQGELFGIVTILRDVTRLREVDRLKTEFLSMAAHELRTPLTSILGFSELLSNRIFTPERTQRYMTMINEQATHLQEIINNLLDIARLEAGRGLELNLEPLDLNLLLENLIVPFNETNKNHTIYLNNPKPIPLIWGDVMRLKQIGKNLLSNAIKYSPQGGRITIHSKVTPQAVQLSFQDEGIGMSAEQQSHLFEQFYRANASNTAVGGTGLGLTITKLIINLHGGEIWVESELGVGTTVHLTLPISAP